MNLDVKTKIRIMTLMEEAILTILVENNRMNITQITETKLIFHNICEKKAYSIILMAIKTINKIIIMKTIKKIKDIPLQINQKRVILINSQVVNPLLNQNMCLKNIKRKIIKNSENLVIIQMKRMMNILIKNNPTTENTMTTIKVLHSKENQKFYPKTTRNLKNSR